MAAPENPEARCLAWIPSGFRSALKDIKTGWIFAGNEKEGEGQWFLELAEPWRSRLSKADKKIGELSASYPRLVPIKAGTIIREQLKSRALDPWLRTYLWTLYVHYFSMSGLLSETDVSDLMKERLVSVDPLYQGALYGSRSRPDLALTLLRRARQIEPELAIPAALQEILEQNQP
jgi:hypothetical protein